MGTMRYKTELLPEAENVAVTTSGIPTGCTKQMRGHWGKKSAGALLGQMRQIRIGKERNSWYREGEGKREGKKEAKDAVRALRGRPRSSPAPDGNDFRAPRGAPQSFP